VIAIIFSQSEGFVNNRLYKGNVSFLVSGIKMGYVSSEQPVETLWGQVALPLFGGIQRTLHGPQRTVGTLLQTLRYSLPPPLTRLSGFAGFNKDKSC
jgi:hypothetical protein